MDGNGTFYHSILTCRNKQYVVFSQRNVGNLATHNATKIYAQYFECAVCLHSMHDTTVGESLLGHAISLLNERAYAIDIFAKLIHARAEYCTFHFYSVLISWQYRVYAYRVAIGNME